MSSHIKNPLALYIGLRYSGAFGNNRFASFVSVMSMIGVCLGVAALIVVASVMNGLEDNMKNRVLSVVPHAVVSGEHGLTEPDEQITERIKKIPYVTAVAPVVDVNAIIQSSKKLGAVNILAVNPSEYPANDLLASSLDNGQFNALARTPYGIILGARLAQELDLVPGEKVRIMFPLGARYSITGRIPAQRLFTYIGSFYLGSEADGSVGLINLEDGQKVMRLGKKFSGYRVWLEDPFMIERFISDYGSQNVVDWRREKGPLFQAIAMEKKMMSLMLFLIVFVAVFNILSSLIMTVIDKTREIAIMRTMGLKSRTVMQIFMIEVRFYRNGSRNSSWSSVCSLFKSDPPFPRSCEHVSVRSTAAGTDRTAADRYNYFKFNCSDYRGHHLSGLQGGQNTTGRGFTL